MIYQICDVTVSISPWGRVHFSIYLSNHNSLIHQTWSIDRYKQGQYFSEIFWTIWRTGATFQAVFILATCTNYLTNYVKVSGFVCLFFFWKGEWKRIKNGKYQSLKNNRSRYIIISLKLKKGLNLLSSFQHLAKYMLEIFIIKYTSIW